jgi:hypothetical protein
MHAAALVPPVVERKVPCKHAVAATAPAAEKWPAGVMVHAARPVVLL